MPEPHVTRARLNDRLTHATRYPIALLVAPAGFGKSLALRDFLAGARIDAVRFEVRREENTLLTFARRFADVLRPIVPRIAPSLAALQERVLSAGAAPEIVCDRFAEHLKRSSVTIVVDDLHYAAEDPAAIAFLSQLIDRTVDHVNWIVASRSDAGLPVATWLAYGRMDLPIDQYDLRFTLDEALATATAEGVEASARDVQLLWESTEGWPVALTIALRTQTQAAELRAASTREMIYRYLAEQVFVRLTKSQREFSIATSVFSTFDAGIARAFDSTPEFISELRQDVAFLSETAPGQFRYHDLFRDFLEAELLRLGDVAWREALSKGARVLEARSNVAEALALYTRAKDASSILRIVQNDGFRLFERGEADALSAALDAVPDDLRRANPAALGLEATLEAARGHVEPALRGFVAAIELAGDDELRLALVHRYAIELVRQGHDCIALLERYSRDSAVPAALRVPLLGTLATAYARASRAEKALTAMSSALELLDPSVGDDARARLYQQAAYVYSEAQDHDRARRYAMLSIDLALPRNLYDVAVRAYSALYTIAYDGSDDPIGCLTILDKLLDCAREGGSAQGRLYGLMASYDIEADRGNEAALDRIEAQLAEMPGMLAQNRSEALLPAMALRAAWRKDFRRAYELLSSAGEHQSDERSAMHFAEMALYACAAGMHDEGRTALAAAEAALNRWRKPTRRALRARLALVLAELTRARLTSAHRHLALVQKHLVPAMPRIVAFTYATTEFYRRALGQGDGVSTDAALERLRAEQFAGIARLLDALPLSESGEGGYAALTATEREILQLLANGGTTKSMATQTARSPRTIDTHVRSICKKLSCRSRRAAVTIAIGAGWVQNE